MAQDRVTIQIVADGSQASQEIGRTVTGAGQAEQRFKTAATQAAGIGQALANGNVSLASMAGLAGSLGGTFGVAAVAAVSIVAALDAGYRALLNNLDSANATNKALDDMLSKYRAISTEIKGLRPDRGAADSASIFGDVEKQAKEAEDKFKSLIRVAVQEFQRFSIIGPSPFDLFGDLSGLDGLKERVEEERRQAGEFNAKLEKEREAAADAERDRRLAIGAEETKAEEERLNAIAVADREALDRQRKAIEERKRLEDDRIAAIEEAKKKAEADQAKREEDARKERTARDIEAANRAAQAAADATRRANAQAIGSQGSNLAANTTQQILDLLKIRVRAHTPG